MAGSIRFLLALGAAGDAVAQSTAAWLLERFTRSGRANQALRRLEQLGHISARTEGHTDGRVFRVSPQGKRVALDGVDPAAEWKRPWDGTWRMVAFDVPEIDVALRTRLRRRLHELRFGWLQNSVWVSPDPLTTFRAELGERGIAPDSLLLLDARPAGGESHEAIVQSAWDLPRLARAWAAYRTVLRQHPSSAGRDLGPWRKWFDAEHHAWCAVASRDPFLPEALLPPDYSGREIWQEREVTMARAGKLLCAAAAAASD